MQKNQDQNHWENIGKTYAAFWKSKAKQEINKKETRFINRYLHKTKSRCVLDIGVGYGRIIENYLANSKASKIYGVDWAKSMVDYCKDKFKDDKRVKSITVCNISREQILFQEGFDFISAIRVLKYNKNWQEIAGKILSLLGKQGILVFTIPNKNAFLRFTNPETAIYSATKDEIEKLAEIYRGRILQITTFTKLPDVLYDIFDKGFYVQAVLSLENLLRKFFGDIFLGREFFVAVSRKK